MLEYENHWKEATYKRLSFSNSLREEARKGILNTLCMLSTNKIDTINSLHCIYCHYVFDDQKEKFRAILQTLCNQGYSFISSKECIDIILKKKQIKGNLLHLSFDDGFDNIYTNAAPVLSEMNIPATAFIPTKFVDGTYEQIKDYCLNKTKYNRPIEMLTWNHVKELSLNGFEIGSHTDSHANLGDEEDPLLRYEIDSSKRLIEDKLGIDCDYIAWPYGTLSNISRKALEEIKCAGYLGCFGAYRGSVEPGKTSRLLIPRHHFETQWPIKHIQYFIKGHFETKEDGYVSNLF